jgi:hypothetical protein
MISAKLVQALIGYIARQAKSKGLKMESWGPKGTIVVNMELGDYLNVGGYPTQGNGASIIGPGIITTLKRSRRYTFNTISQHNGIRYNSKISSPQVINMTKSCRHRKEICLKYLKN